MSENKIAAVTRTEFGKGAARRARRDGLVPAVLYGHGSDPVHVSLPGHDITLALRQANALLTISIDEGKDFFALPKQVQKNPVRGSIEHVDLVIVKRGEKVHVEVPLVIVGDEAFSEAIVTMDQQSIMLEVEATHIPASIEIDVAGLEIGDTIVASQLKLPEGAVFPGSPDDLILGIAAAPSAVAADAAAAEAAEAAGAGAEA